MMEAALAARGGEYERGCPLSYRGSGGDAPGKIWELMVPEKRFYACFRSKCPVSNFNLKASLTYFLQYFASISAYTGDVAGIQRKI